MLMNHIQVMDFEKLVLFLRRLKVMGILHYEIESISLTDFGKPVRYKIFVTGYNPNKKAPLSSDEKLTAYFISSAELEACIRQTE